MTYTPNGKRLLITRRRNEIKSKGGLVMPESVTDKKLSEGYVVRIGLGCENKYWEEGMHVLFAQFAGQEVMVEGVVYQVIPEDDILVYSEDKGVAGE